MPGPHTGELTPWAQEVVDDFASYTEVSPSGTGVKIFARGCPTLARNKLAMGTASNGGKAPAIEAYGEGRYFALTGHHVAGTPDRITDASAAWARLAARLAAAEASSARGWGAPLLHPLLSCRRSSTRC